MWGSAGGCFRYALAAICVLSGMSQAMAAETLSAVMTVGVTVTPSCSIERPSGKGGPGMNCTQGTKYTVKTEEAPIPAAMREETGLGGERIITITY